MSELSLLGFFKQFPDEASARKHFENIRWGGNRTCPCCGSSNTVEVKNETPMPYRCKDCRKHFSVRTGTILSESKLAFQKWLLAIYILTSSRKGISSIYLSKTLECTQKTAWFLAHRIREVWEQSNNKLGNQVEVDETFIGGKESNKHASEKKHAGRGAVGKIAVIGAVERNGQVKASVIQDTSAKTLKKFINDNIEKDSQVYTDNFSGYNNLKNYRHESVKHSVGEYVREKAHTNGIESFWAVLKRGYYGIYHSMGSEHLQRYVNEFVYRYNQKASSIIGTVNDTIVKSIGNRLTYKRLING